MRLGCLHLRRTLLPSRPGAALLPSLPACYCPLPAPAACVLPGLPACSVTLENTLKEVQQEEGDAAAAVADEAAPDAPAAPAEPAERTPEEEEEEKVRLCLLLMYGCLSGVWNVWHRSTCMCFPGQRGMRPGCLLSAELAGDLEKQWEHCPACLPACLPLWWLLLLHATVAGYFCGTGCMRLTSAQPCGSPPPHHCGFCLCGAVCSK